MVISIPAILAPPVATLHARPSLRCMCAGPGRCVVCAGPERDGEAACLLLDSCSAINCMYVVMAEHVDGDDECRYESEERETDTVAPSCCEQVL